MKKNSATHERLSITDWSAQDRPREKFAAQGATALSDAELLAILLRTGNASENAVELAKRILLTCDNQLYHLSNISLNELSSIKGIGSAKATTLLAAIELGKRIRSSIVEEKQQIKEASDVIELMQHRIADIKHEEFWAIFLNQSAKILSIKQISKGGLTSVSVDQRILLQEAILQSATNVIVCHNHPSGSVSPSIPDKQLTRTLQEACNTLNINLLDHIILHKDNYFSFAEKGIL